MRSVRSDSRERRILSHIAIVSMYLTLKYDSGGHLFSITSVNSGKYLFSSTFNLLVAISGSRRTFGLLVIGGLWGSICSLISDHLIAWCTCRSKSLSVDWMSLKHLSGKISA